LGPSSRRSAQIDDGTCRREEVILPVELDELERRSRPIPVGVCLDDGVSAGRSAWTCVCMSVTAMQTRGERDMHEHLLFVSVQQHGRMPTRDRHVASSRTLAPSPDGRTYPTGSSQVWSSCPSCRNRLKLQKNGLAQLGSLQSRAVSRSRSRSRSRRSLPPPPPPPPPPPRSRSRRSRSRSPRPPPPPCRPCRHSQSPA